MDFMRQFSYILLLLALLSGRLSAQDIILPYESTWKIWRGSAVPSEDPQAWREPLFDDSNWESLRAPFYYGVNLGNRGTFLEDMQGNYLSLFMRNTFNIPDMERVSSLRATVWVDDGAVIWINGHRVVSQNFFETQDPGLESTAATAPFPTPFIPHLLFDFSEYLTEGENTIAVQGLNTALSSSDFIFDMELVELLRLEGPPDVVSISPEPGEVNHLSFVEVEFDREVDGVSAPDLLVNGQSADAMTSLNPTSYRFTFPALVPGNHVLSWRESHAITDRVDPFNEFSPDPGFYSYTVFDRTPPVVTRIDPQPGSMVRVLEYIRVWFDEPVINIEPADLRINGMAARLVNGIGAGPYTFRLPALLRPSDVEFEWATDHGIGDTSIPSNLFESGSWTYRLTASSEEIPRIVINEILASNTTGLTDEAGDAVDWIELKNLHSEPVNLRGWTLSDDSGDPSKWVFPEVTIEPDGFLVVFASGKDRKEGDGSELHTNYSLSKNGEFLGLYAPGLPVIQVSQIEPAYPPQRNDVSFGRGQGGALSYFELPTPGMENGDFSLGAMAPPALFSVKHGIYQEPFSLRISSSDPAASIVYTLDGTEPDSLNGMVLEPGETLTISETTTLRARTIRPGFLPGEIGTQSYLFIEDPDLLTVPAISLVTDPSNLYGETGIIGIQGGEYVPRPGAPQDMVWIPIEDTDFHNPSGTGREWERPVSMEFLWPGNSSLPNLQIDCGIRVHGSGFMRPKLRSDSKFGFRLHFRGQYGPTAMEYPMFDKSPVETHSSIVLRSGHNDPENPFITDEMMRRLFKKTGQLAPMGRFVHLFLNGEYQGYYNPTERINDVFLQEHNAKPDSEWDLVKPFLEIDEGDSVAIDELLSIATSRSLSVPSFFEEVSTRLDLINFADYILVNIYGDTGDWTFSNWRAMRERKSDALFQFMIWDAEFALGIYGRPVDRNSIGDPRELGNSSQISTLFRALSESPEFRLIMADRFHRHFMNGGPLSNASILETYMELKNTVEPFIPNFLTHIEDTWIPNRSTAMLRDLDAAGMLASESAPVLNRFGGRVPEGFQLEMTAPMGGEIFYTLNGEDPRVPIKGGVSDDALLHEGQSIVIDDVLHLKARTLLDGEWSALTEAEFEVEALRNSIVISEIMYHPIGGSAYEFIEITNLNDFSVDLSGYSFTGIGYTFPPGSILQSQGILFLASNDDPTLFNQRYPQAQPFGFYARALSNGGELIEILDTQMQVVVSVDYDDENGWPVEADGQGFSLVVIDPRGDLNDPANWRLSREIGGTPGYQDTLDREISVVLNEFMAWNASAISHDNTFPEWIELFNPGDMPIDISGWGFSNQGDQPRQFVFPQGTLMQPASYLILWLDAEGTVGTGLSADIEIDPYGGGLYLFNQRSELIDFLSYGIQIRDTSIGRESDGDFVLNATPTPGEVNIPATLGSLTQVRINEWLADSRPGEPDWLELYNPDPRPIALSGVSISNGSDISQFKDLSFMGGHGFLWLEAGNGNPINFKLPASGSLIILLDPDGKSLDLVSYGLQVEHVTQGRFPDGGDEIRSFPDGGTPGLSNGGTDFPDRDEDHISDEWELANGLDPGNPTDALEDADQDGSNNYEEFVAGTDPNESNSVFGIRITDEDTAFVVQFEGTPGRGYRVLFTPTLGGNWETVHVFDDTTRTVSEPLEYRPDPLLIQSTGYFQIEPFILP